jgi:hypothetical protein
MSLTIHQAGPFFPEHPRTSPDRASAKAGVSPRTAPLQGYVNYAQEFSRGNTEAYFPTDWAKDHVVANVQKFMSGKYKLCRGIGVDEIGELE